MIFLFRLSVLITGLFLTAITVGRVAWAEDNIRIGVLAAMTGPYAEYGLEAKRGVELALVEFDGHVSRKNIELIFETGDGAPARVAARAQTLIEEHGADIIIGPLSGGEGPALKNFAKSTPAITFLNGASAARDLTLLDPAPNFFRFTTDAAQWMAGLGRYSYIDKGYRRVVTLGENFSFPYTQVMGFLVEFCSLGGTVAEQFWLPLSDKPYAAITAQLLQAEADAIFIALDGSNTADFLEQYWKDGGRLPIIGGSVTFDPVLLSSNSLYHTYLPGAISASPLADGDQARSWQAFVAAYRKHYPSGAHIPSIFAVDYYINTKAALLALEHTGGDLTSEQSELRQALAKLNFETPAGRVSLDENRNAVANNYVIEGVLGEDKRLRNEVAYVATRVDQTLGMGRERYLALGAPGPNTPSCP